MKFFSLKIINFYKNKNINLLDYTINNNLIINRQKSHLNDYIKFFLKNGFKKKIKLQLLKSFNFFFFFFNSNNTEYLNFQKNIDILKNSLFLNFNFFKINLILEFLINLINPIFDIVCYNTPLKYKKKSKKNFFFKLNYLSGESRKKRALKWLYLYSFTFNDKMLSRKVFKSILFTFLEGKKSFLYKKKIQIYKKVIRV